MSPEIKSVTIDQNTKLEVLCWGSSGPTLLFLAGGGDPGQVWYSFAPRFSDNFRIIAPTRRNYNKPPRPLNEFSSKVFAEDVNLLLDALEISYVNVIAHSFGGSELNYLATNYPEKVRSLIYLDAGADFSQVYEDPGWWEDWPEEPLLTREELTSFTSMTNRKSRHLGVPYPEAAIRKLFDFNEGGELEGGALDYDEKKNNLLRESMFSVDYNSIPHPALAIYAKEPPMQYMFGYFSELDETNQSLAERKLEQWKRVWAAQRDRFEREKSSAKVIDIEGASHYVYLSHSDYVEQLIREFLDETSN